MFSFLQKRRQEKATCTRIGVELHRQIMAAFEINESNTSTRLPTAYAAGYVPTFIRESFAVLSATNGCRLEAKYRCYICDAVLPGRLNEVIDRQTAAYELAGNIPDVQRNRRPGEQSPTEHSALFELGCREGQRDAANFAVGQASSEGSLTRFLVAQPR